jgi:hypothetical protein
MRNGTSESGREKFMDLFEAKGSREDSKVDIILMM